MPQQQRPVKVIFLDGSTQPAEATGNNAAWLCPCGRGLPLLGRTGFLKGASEAMRVECSECHRDYFVAPKDKDQGPVLEIRELKKHDGFL